jgi:hypothetical protein
VLLFERESEAVDDGAQDLQQLGHAVVPLRLVDEVVEDVVDLLSTHTKKASLQKTTLPLIGKKDSLIEIACGMGNGINNRK